MSLRRPRPHRAARRPRRPTSRVGPELLAVGRRAGLPVRPDPTFEPTKRADGCGTTTGLLAPSRVVVGPDGSSCVRRGRRQRRRDRVRPRRRHGRAHPRLVRDRQRRRRPAGLRRAVRRRRRARRRERGGDRAGRPQRVRDRARRPSLISWFARDPATGALTQRGCLKARPDLGERCLQARGLRGAADVVVSPDGTRVYVAGDRQRRRRGLRRRRRHGRPDPAFVRERHRLRRRVRPGVRARGRQPARAFARWQAPRT